MTEKINYDELEWDDLMDIALDTEDENRKTIMNVLLTVGNECDKLDTVREMVVKMLENDFFPKICKFVK